MHKKTLVGWASSPSWADKMSTPQEKLLHKISCVSPLLMLCDFILS
ncbi:hypothetical protein FDUTEX481_09025 [Tolypothrix sp. PCC 7601]|nr:hypothetical protein FDUTEX481_09025 [Tolypothrix sp. PCC 7601]